MMLHRTPPAPAQLRSAMLFLALGLVAELLAQPGVRVHLQNGARLDAPFTSIDRVSHAQVQGTAFPQVQAVTVTQTQPFHFRVEVGGVQANGPLAFSRGVCWSASGDPDVRDSLLQTAPDGALVDTLLIYAEAKEFRFRSYAIGDGYVLYGPVAVLQIPVYPPGSGVFDSEGNYYRSGIIAGHEWMLDNLRVQHYANGDAINLVDDDSDWHTTSSGAWCYPGPNSQGQSPAYGVLYNGYAATDGRNVCPAGWHVPVDAEWRTLEQYVGVPDTSLSASGVRGAAQAAGGAMKSTLHWQAPNTGATNASGFDALPAGGRTYYDGNLFNAGMLAQFWVHTHTGEQRRLRLLEYDHAGVGSYFSYVHSGASIRCVKD